MEKSKLLSVIKNKSIFNFKNSQGYSKLNFEFFKNFTSEHTRKCYFRDIRQFFDFTQKNFEGIFSLCDIGRIHGVAYKEWLLETDYAPKTINRKMSANSSYFDFLLEKDLVLLNPFQGVRRPRQSVIDPTLELSDQQVSDLFEALEC